MLAPPPLSLSHNGVRNTTSVSSLGSATRYLMYADSMQSRYADAIAHTTGFPTWLISAIADSKLNSEYEGGDHVLRTTVDEVMHLVDRKVLTNALYMAMFVARHNPIGTRPPASFAFFFLPHLNGMPGRRSTPIGDV